MQDFKDNDAEEANVRDCFLPLLNGLGLDIDDFFEGAYTAFPLGDLLFELKASPLSKVVDATTFRNSFTAIHQFFTRPGTFEFYLSIFRTIFGEDVDVEFTIPGDGRLQINIEALAIELRDFTARRIVDDAYIFEHVVEQPGLDNILFQGTTGLQTQEELDLVMKELRVAGVFTEATLSII